MIINAQDQGHDTNVFKASRQQTWTLLLLDRVCGPLGEAMFVAGVFPLRVSRRLHSTGLLKVSMNDPLGQAVSVVVPLDCEFFMASTSSIYNSTVAPLAM